MTDLSIPALNAWSDRIVSARIIAKALIDMKGNDVRSVFEAATNKRTSLEYWTTVPNGSQEILRAQGYILESGKPFNLTSTPFPAGQSEQAAAALGAALLTQLPKDIPMDLKIKGLQETVTRAREGISAVRTAASGLHESTNAFVATATEVQRQIDAAHDDLKFEATQLGNSPPASEDASKDTTSGASQ